MQAACPLEENSQEERRKLKAVKTAAAGYYFYIQ